MDYLLCTRQFFSPGELPCFHRFFSVPTRNSASMLFTFRSRLGWGGSPKLKSC
jgi:hypothetical protein